MLKFHLELKYIYFKYELNIIYKILNLKLSKVPERSKLRGRLKHIQ